MSHLPFLKALTTKRIPVNRIKTNPQCILVFSQKEIKLGIQTNSEIKLPQQFFWQVFFSPPLSSTNNVEVSLLTKLDLSADSGRWHPVVQLLFPLAFAGCARLSSADRAISSPRSQNVRFVKK